MALFDSHPIIPVVVIEDPENAVPLAQALLRGGIGIIEVTFRTAAAAAAIKSIHQQCPDMLVGAGTVVTDAQAELAVTAGAQFALAPGMDPETVRYFKERAIPFIPGVATPSEIQAAYREGCRMMKFFPAGASGGPSYLKAMAAPYRSLGLQFCPTGGVTTANINDYLSLPEVFAVGGTWIATPTQIANGDWSEIETQAKTAREISSHLA